jgi:hypothetical protein
MSALVLLAALAAGPPTGLATPVIRAEGTEGCPDAAAVSTRLAGLLDGGDAPEAAAADVVVLSVAEADLLLRLSRADGTLVGERRIPRSNRCAELADAVAALVAAWEADLQPAPPPPVPPPVAGRFEPVPVLVQAAAPERERGGYELGVLPALWVGGGRFALAGTLRAAAWSRRAPVGMTLALSATFPVDGPMAGLTRWRRHALSGGVMGRLRHNRLFVDASAEVVLGWLVMNRESGEGAGTGTRAAFDPGLTIGLRAGTQVARRLELYASLSAWGAAWDGSANTGAVPHWGLLMGMGGSFLFGPF